MIGKKEKKNDEREKNQKKEKERKSNQSKKYGKAAYLQSRRGVQNGAVGLGGAVGHVVFCLQNDDFVLVARQCVGCSGADHTTADDSNIIHYSFPPVSSALAHREPGRCAVCTKKERTKTKA